MEEESSRMQMRTHGIEWDAKPFNGQQLCILAITLVIELVDR